MQAKNVTFSHKISSEMLDSIIFVRKLISVESRICFTQEKGDNGRIRISQETFLVFVLDKPTQLLYIHSNILRGGKNQTINFVYKFML